MALGPLCLTNHPIFHILSDIFFLVILVWRTVPALLLGLKQASVSYLTRAPGVRFATFFLGSGPPGSLSIVYLPLSLSPHSTCLECISLLSLRGLSNLSFLVISCPLSLRTPHHDLPRLSFAPSTIFFPPSDLFSEPSLSQLHLNLLLWSPPHPLPSQSPSAPPP